ncbi:unnamed protein product [Enterobius vermicularis]|uniref:Leishmanolysin-like peptidase n=1 Tax=Enterobius vermicularis TaxID=51028 RepID=A0A3P6IM11_ENTVE|nr:unnamed protein product [Enterobius vermicularis]
MNVPHVDDIVFNVPIDIEGESLLDGSDTANSLLPEAIGYWQQALSVRPTISPIRLYRKCVSNRYYTRPGDNYQSCEKACRENTTCGEVIVPDEHLYDIRRCDSSGLPDGPGVSGADFLLYVSAVKSERCVGVDTVAYAAHCQQEAIFDRPIAGHVNLCPSALSVETHDREVLLSTVKHEILHALGFSAGLYAFFRDENGRPRTKRWNPNNKPESLNVERGYYNWDSSTIRTIVRDDWWTAKGRTLHEVHVMVTPRVRKEAILHFGCKDLEGAELENQGGEGTALTHWEKRLFENEAMTGTHTQNPVYSRLTLALLEDSGWYKANYSVAETLHWGKDLGCEFAMKSCGEWIQNQHLPPSPYCDEIKHDGTRSLATTRCTTQRDSLALCNLVPYKQPLPEEYLNFDYLKGVRSEGLKYYGGSVELADYCPYNQEFEWKATNLTERRDSRCELPGNLVPEDTNTILEVYGEDSMCFDLKTSWTEKRCGMLRNFTQYMAGCYEYHCMDGLLHLQIFNGSDLYPCYHPGQPIYIRRIVNGWLREGTILCPACDDFCHEPPNDYIGDEPLKEPCFACAVKYSLTLLLILLSLPSFL